MKKHRKDIYPFGGRWCVREGWHWVQATNADLEQAALTDVAESRRDRIGWTLTFALAAVAAVVAIVKEVVA